MLWGGCSSGMRSCEVSLGSIETHHGVESDDLSVQNAVNW